MKIGIFDSGIGGLTVAQAVKNKLPQAELIYFGDTAHLPYGDKSPSSIRHYSARITQFLLSKHCNAIVIACNTASAHAFNTVQDVAGPEVPIFNVIDPVVKHVVDYYKSEHIGIIATRGTIKTRVYPRRIKKLDDSLKVTSRATPLLAPMIEEGFFNNSISKTVISSYLEAKELQGIKALILGCTHYPLIQKEVNDFFLGKVDIIDSANIVAQSVAEGFSLKGDESINDEFYVSDYTRTFEESTQTFFGQEIQLREERIFD